MFRFLPILYLLCVQVALGGVPTVGPTSGSRADYVPAEGQGPEVAIKKCLLENGVAYLIPGTYQFTAPIEGPMNNVRIMGAAGATLVPASTTSTTYTSTGITIAFADDNPGTFTDSNGGFATLGLQPGDVFLVSGAAATGTNNTYWIVSTVSASEIMVAGPDPGPAPSSGTLSADASAGETVVFTKIPCGLLNLTGSNIYLDGLTIATSTSPSDNSCAIRLGGGNIKVSGIKQRALGAASTSYIGIQVIPTSLESQQGIKFTDCTFTSAATCTGFEHVQLIAAGFSILNYGFVNCSFQRDSQSDNTTILKHAIKIEKAGKGTITACNFEGLAATAWVTNNSSAEGHHFAFVGNHLELGTATAGYLDLNGGRFVSIVGNVFGRLSSDTGAVNIGASADAQTGQDIIISANHFHNIGTTQGAATGTIIADSINGLMIDGNDFGICTVRQVLCGTAAANVTVRNNKFSTSTSTISAAIEFLKTSNANYVVDSNIAYKNSGTWTAFVATGGTYTLQPNVSSGTLTNNVTIASNVISRAAGSWITNGFAVGDLVVITGSPETAADAGKTLLISVLTGSQMTVIGNTLTDDVDADEAYIITRVAGLTPSRNTIL